MGNLEVIDRDDSLWVLNKPSGLLSAPGRGPEKQDCLLRRVQDLDPTVRLVHRLDQATSGLMLLARGPESQRRLNAAFAQRRVEKVYLAVVGGCMDDAGRWQVIDAPSTCTGPTGQGTTWDPPANQARPGGGCWPAMGRARAAGSPCAP